MTPEHIPVMLDQVLDQLALVESLKTVVDGTLGLGGYSQAILDRFPDSIVFGIDQDGDALEFSKKRLSGYGSRFAALEGNFSEIRSLMRRCPPADAAVFDLGVSNMQLAVAERGFSFREKGPLDMRMDGGKSGGISAYDVINGESAQAMSHIFRVYGEEKYSWVIAKGIVGYREKNGPISDTEMLVRAIREALPAPVMRKSKGHPARRVFQALRIFVNGEIEALEKGLDEAFDLLNGGGMILVVDYHSLEDRTVKWRFRRWANESRGVIVTKKPLLPSEEEVERNPKSRSAKLRSFIKAADRS